MKWYLQVLKKYAVFSGRARRKEYWMYTLFCVIFLVVAMIIDNILGTTFKIHVGDVSTDLHYGYVYSLYALATFLPGLAVGVRRLHDVGKSGWMYLLFFASIAVSLFAVFGKLIILMFLSQLFVIGIGIWFLVLMVKDGNPGENKYGPNPKETQAEEIPIAPAQ